MTAHRLTRVTILFAACAMPGGCFSIGRDAKPDFPPAIDPHIYDARIEQTKSLAVDDRPVMSIGGARIAEGGIYVDLILVNMPRTEGVEPRAVGSGLGDFFSDLKNPGCLIEIRDAVDQPVELRAMQRPRMGGLIMPGTCILYLRSPRYLAEAEAKEAYVDVCMWRTKRQLSAGTYRMRLLPHQSSDEEEGRLARISEFYLIDSKWRPFDVERAPSPQDS